MWFLFALGAALLLTAGASHTPTARKRLVDGPVLPPRPSPPTRLPDPPIEPAVLPEVLGGLCILSVVGMLHALHVLDGWAALVIIACTVPLCVVASLVVRHLQWQRWHEETARRRAAHETNTRAWEEECEAIRDEHLAKRQLEAAYVEALQVERDRQRQARAAHENAQRQEQQEETNVRGALLWWTTQSTRVNEFVAEHWRELIGSEKSLLAQFANPDDPCSSMEKCLALAFRAVPRMRQEIAYLMGDDTCTSEDVAMILRRRHGFAVERLLPLAQDYAREARRVPPAPDPKLLAEAEAEATRLGRERLIALREAGAWWTSAGQHYADADWLERHVRLHRRWILGQREAARAAYRDSSRPAATYEAALEFSRWALATQGGEVAYHLGVNGNGLPSEQEVARILRAHHGHMAEVLIPMALELADKDPSSIYGRLDEEAVAQFEAAQTVVQVERVADALIERERAQQLRDGAPEADLESRVEAYAKFIREAAYKIKCDRGFISE